MNTKTEERSFSGAYYHENSFHGGRKLASRARPGEKKGGGGRWGW